MSSILFEIKQYKVSITTYQTDTELGNTKILAVIECEGSDNYRCLISIVEGILPKVKYSEKNKTLGIYRSAYEFLWFIDLLRNEIPINCRIFPGNIEVLGIETEIEKIGKLKKSRIQETLKV